MGFRGSGFWGVGGLIASCCAYRLPPPALNFYAFSTVFVHVATVVLLNEMRLSLAESVHHGIHCSCYCSSANKLWKGQGAGERRGLEEQGSGEAEMVDTKGSALMV